MKCKELSNSKSKLVQPFISFPSPNDIFHKKMCSAFLSADIPLHKLNNNNLKSFLSQYTGKSVPDVGTLRNKIVPQLINENMDEVKLRLKDNYYYIIIDETTDARGYNMCSVLIGVLNCEKFHDVDMISLKKIETTNYSTICQLINKCISDFNLDNDKFLLLLSDAATYMVKAGKYLEPFFPNMIHVTCLAHGVNRVGEKVRELFPEVNKLINNGKKVFLKAPRRVEVYREIMKDKQLPPQPILTRWGTWLNAALSLSAENPSINVHRRRQGLK